eukprot:5052829-Alexandrium_andersonii.AAC.1
MTLRPRHPPWPWRRAPPGGSPVPAYFEFLQAAGGATHPSGHARCWARVGGVTWASLVAWVVWLCVRGGGVRVG